MHDEKKMYLLTDFAETLKKFFNKELVYGNPIEIQGKTIITVTRVDVGGGGGGGGGEEITAGEPGTETPAEKTAKPSGSGMGFGFGGTARPVGVLVTENGETKWIPITDKEQIILKAIAAIAGFLKLCLKMKKKARRTKENCK